MDHEQWDELLLKRCEELNRQGRRSEIQAEVEIYGQSRPDLESIVIRDGTGKEIARYQSSDRPAVKRCHIPGCFAWSWEVRPGKFRWENGLCPRHGGKMCHCHASEEEYPELKKKDPSIAARFGEPEITLLFPGANMRCGNDDRKRAADLLGEHYAAGRISMTEFDERLQQIWNSQTYGDLHPPFNDLPGAKPPKGPAILPEPSVPDPGIPEKRKASKPMSRSTAFAIMLAMPVAAILLVMGIIRLVVFLAAVLT